MMNIEFMVHVIWKLDNWLDHIKDGNSGERMNSQSRLSIYSGVEIQFDE